MNYSCVLLSLLILLCVTPAWAATLRETLGTLYRQRDAAASRRDSVGYMTVCTPDYTYFTAAMPPQNFTHAQRKLTRGYSSLRRAHVTTTLQVLTTASDGVTVLAQERTEALLADSFKPSGSRLVVLRNVRDFWVRTGTSAWKMKRRRLLSTSTTVKGVPVRTNLSSPHLLPKAL